MADLFQITLVNGIPSAGDGEVATINALMADGGMTTIGNTTDTANTSTTATPATGIGIWKQISKSLQAIHALWPTALGAGGGLKVDGSGTALPVSIASVPSHAVTNSGSFPVQEKSGKTVSASFTSGTTGYVPNDVAGGALTFTSIAGAAEDLVIESASLRIDRNGVIAGETTYRLAFFSVTPPSALADSANWTLPSGDRASFLGLVSLGTIIDEGDTCYVEVNNLNKRLKTAGANLFAYLLVGGTYTPTAVNHTVTVSSRTA